MSITPDDLLPKPLLEVRQWKKPLDSRLPNLFPIDIAVEVGGALREYFDRLKYSQEFNYCLPGCFIKGEREIDILGLQMKKEIQSVLFAENPLEFIFLGEPNQATRSWLEECCFDREFSSQVMRAPTPMAWAKILFPETCTILGELELARRLNGYLGDFPEVESRPWSGFRFFSGFLRQQGLEQAAQAGARESAHREALFSPQDEEHELRALATTELCMNPTLQFVRSESTITVYARWRAQAMKKDLVWQEAVVIDALQEEAKLKESELVKSLQIPNAQEILLGLVSQGFILRGP